MGKNYAIEMVDVSKSFGGTYALKNVTFQVEAGTCHALVGENGAGKSTMMKILAGTLRKDSGKIFVNGDMPDLKSRTSSQKAGIAFVPQELDYISCFSVAENIYLGEEQRGRTKLIDSKKLYQDAEALLKRLKIDLPAEKLAGELNVSEQQMMVIARILSKDANIIIMDEPTARLGHHEIGDLLAYIKFLKNQGKTIIFISHHLDEVYEICDNVTILRDGHTIETLPMRQINQDELIHKMVNRKIDEELKVETGHKIDKVVMKVEHLNKGEQLKDINFQVHAGEILGFFGLVGAGRTEAIRAILGIDKCDTVNITLDGVKVVLKNNRQALKKGIALVPEERRKQGVILNVPISQNISLGNLKKVQRGCILSKKKEAQLVEKAAKQVGVICNSLSQTVGELSGGNQQKVVLAKYMDSNIKVFILDEPTRGIDVGAKRQIYDIIEAFAAKGLAVIVISSEIPELQLISDRVCIMREGRITKELKRKDILNSDQVLQYAISD